jgi:hypothetical protein
MRTGRVILGETALTILLLGAAPAAAAEDEVQNVTIIGFRGDTPFVDCGDRATPLTVRWPDVPPDGQKDGQKMWEARAHVSKGYLELTKAKGRDGKGLCVRAYNVKLSRNDLEAGKGKIKDECGPVAAPRGGASRAIGEDCKKK